MARERGPSLGARLCGCFGGGAGAARRERLGASADSVVSENPLKPPILPVKPAIRAPAPEEKEPVRMPTEAELGEAAARRNMIHNIVLAKAREADVGTEVDGFLERSMSIPSLREEIARASAAAALSPSPSLPRTRSGSAKRRSSVRFSFDDADAPPPPPSGPPPPPLPGVAAGNSDDDAPPPPPPSSPSPGHVSFGRSSTTPQRAPASPSHGGAAGGVVAVASPLALGAHLQQP